ncbi:imidazolonepropionase [Enhygromyxa salina]|uniref:Imidazolonepropionase n=1 Tax=Enhygromyxa salina TaxID=215803 RepID=A0A2S9XSJ7_9BACT|nr:amidohydrolase family protein [Enhygromyxa salina]PRP95844.1 imidazolonepropionase [Enhygromyxa salina]
MKIFTDKLRPAFLLIPLFAPLPLLLTALPPAPAEAAPPVVDVDAETETVLLTNATIQVGDGTIIEGGSILIEDGKISKVDEGRIAAGPDATTHDLGGKVVTPGLIAADTSIGLIEIGAEASTRDDARRDGDGPIKSGYDPASAVNADSALIPIQAIEGVTTAAVAPRGGLISGAVAWIDLLPGDHANIVAAEGVAIATNFGRSYAGSRAASLAELREAFEDAKWYRANQRSYERNQARALVAHPLDLRALWPVLDKTIPLVVRAHRASDLLALIELGESLDIELTIVGAAEGWKVAEQLAAAGLTVVVQPTQNLPGSFDTLGARLDSAALLHAAGVEVGIATFDSHNARNITQEAGVAVANGLPRAAALEAITLNAARAYGMDDEYGTIAVGKVASLVVWDGADPFELSTSAEQVWVRGHELEMKSRQTQLRDRYMDLQQFAD